LILLVAGVDTIAFASIWFAFTVDPPSDPYTLPILATALMVILVVVISFSRFTVVLTNSGIEAGFGISKRRFRWDEVGRCYLDEATALQYGGFGIKGGVFNGRKRLVYNVTGTQRVVLEVRGHRYDEFVFSTRRPDAVMRVIRMHTGTPP